LTHIKGRISAAHLFIEAAEEHQPFQGKLIANLSVESTRKDVRTRLGEPSRSREAQFITGLGARGPWDRYDEESLCIHFQYEGSDCRIQLITIMHFEGVPDGERPSV
jgi:hypothetical protein